MGDIERKPKPVDIATSRPKRGLWDLPPRDARKGLLSSQNSPQSREVLVVALWYDREDGLIKILQKLEKIDKSIQDK